MSARKIKSKKERTLVVGQWIEVEVVGGVTRTTRYPDDLEMHKVIADTEKKKGRAVELVYRRLYFVNGIPPEYRWATDDPEQIRYGGMGIQRLRINDWLDMIAREDGGHVLGCEYHMPRPDSRGGCECKACRDMAERIRLNGR